MLVLQLSTCFIMSKALYPVKVYNTRYININITRYMYIAGAQGDKLYT